MRLIAKERILLHLLEAPGPEGIEARSELTQEGIAEGAWIQRRHVPQYTRPLQRDGLVLERRANVRGIRQRRKVYQLTERGRRAALKLRDRVKDEPVRLREGRETRETRLGDLLDRAGKGVPILQLIRQTRETGLVDLEGLIRPSRQTLVEFLNEAPRLTTFVGRERELRLLTQAEGPPVILVRGVPGIGKTWLGARACELLRGRRNLLWHRVRPWDTSQSILSVLSAFLSAIGNPALRSVLDRGEEALARRVLRETLPGTNAFLVFDDAQDGSEKALSVLSSLKEIAGESADVKVVLLTRKSLPFISRKDLLIDGTVGEVELVGLGPQETMSLLDEGSELPRLANLAQKLGGHPLLVALARSATRHATSNPLQDIQRVLEEQVYRELSRQERTMMKLASLYRVPVPRTALFARSSLTHDVLLSLLDKSLIRRIGSDAFEVHDAVRVFFRMLLTPMERDRFGAFAVDRLRELGTRHLEKGNVAPSVNCISNALELTTDSRLRLELNEALGDSHDRLGDVESSLTAYKEALKGTRDPTSVARLHRKVGQALRRRGEIRSASEEIQAGLAVLGDVASVERARLELLDCRILIDLERQADARTRADSALMYFAANGIPRGQAEALLLLGELEMHSVDRGPSMAERYLRDALDLAPAVGDPWITMEAHSTLAHYLGYHCIGRVDEGFQHVRALEVLSKVEADPAFQAQAHKWRGSFEVDFRADYALADFHFGEAIKWAKKTHDVYNLFNLRAWLGQLSLIQGRFQEARHRLEELFKTSIDHPSPRWALQRVEELHSVSEISWQLAECCLLLNDLEGFRGAVSAFKGSESASHTILGMLIRAIELHLNGDSDASLAAFEETARVSEDGFSATSAVFTFHPHLAHLYSAAALRSVGRTKEAETHSRKALDIARLCRLEAIRSVLPLMDRRLTTVFGSLATRHRT